MKNIHHRIPRSHGGTNDRTNLSYVEKKKHDAFHELFGTMSPQEICDELTRTWIDVHWEITARRKDEVSTVPETESNACLQENETMRQMHVETLKGGWR